MFNIDIGSDKNYFLQSRKGAFHILLSKSPKPRCIIASPAGNSGCMLLFDGKNAPELIDSPAISGKEEVTFKLKTPEPHTISLSVLGSIRIIRCYTEGGGITDIYKNMEKISSNMSADTEEYKIVKDWMEPEWEITDNGKNAKIKIKALDGKNQYQLSLSTDSGAFSLSEIKKSTIGINSKLQLPKGNISVTYSSSYKPLTPFPLDELLNKKALKTFKSLSGSKKEHAQELLNSLRFLAYKEKFLAGSWRFLTYFGRDTLLSLRMLTPIVTPEAIEAEFTGIAARLDNNGEISHEEDIGDQAVIDQLNDLYNKKKQNKKPADFAEIINNYNMVDSNYLALPLLMDYYYIGGRKLFSSDNKLFIPILKNVNYALKEALTLKPVPIKDNLTVGDWRDSESGLAYGKYSFSINAAMIPAAIRSFDLLLSKKVWNRNDLLKTAEENKFESIKFLLNNADKFENLKETWFTMWKKFHVTETDKQRTQLLNINREKLGFPKLTATLPPYKNGFLALSLDDSLKAVPIIQSDTLFMILDFPIQARNNWLDPACAPFEVDLPDGLISEAGIIVASPALAPEKYIEMFDRNHYHGEVIWAWPQLMLKIALQKQLGLWITPTPGNKELSDDEKTKLSSMLNTVNKLINNLQKWSTSELWTWKLDKKGKVIPTAYGQEKGNVTESNAIQLWSVAALGVQLWDAMKETTEK